jgi:hypothetical protein
MQIAGGMTQIVLRSYQYAYMSFSPGYQIQNGSYVIVYVGVKVMFTDPEVVYAEKQSPPLPLL